MTGDLLYSGKSKDLFLTDDENLCTLAKDRRQCWSVARKETIKGKAFLIIKSHL